MSKTQAITVALAAAAASVLYVRINPQQKGIERFYRCGIKFGQEWQRLEGIDGATALRLEEEQMLEVSTIRPAELGEEEPNEDDPSGDSDAAVAADTSSAAPADTTDAAPADAVTEPPAADGAEAPADVPQAAADAPTDAPPAAAEVPADVPPADTAASKKKAGK